MNEKTAKLIAVYARESGRPKKDIADWWKSLVEEDRYRARRQMTVFIEARQKDKKNGAAQSAPAKTNPRGGDSK